MCAHARTCNARTHTRARTHTHTLRVITREIYAYISDGDV